MLQRSLVLFTMAIVGLVACSESFTPEQSGYWLQKLEDEKTRIEGLKNLGKFKEPAVVDAVINLLEQKGDAAGRGVHFGTTRRHPCNPKPYRSNRLRRRAWKECKVSPHQQDQYQRARALAMLKTEAALDPIVRLTNSSDQNTTQAAIESLGNLGNPGRLNHSQSSPAPRPIRLFARLRSSLWASWEAQKP